MNGGLLEFKGTLVIRKISRDEVIQSLADPINFEKTIMTCCLPDAYLWSYVMSAAVETPDYLFNHVAPHSLISNGI